jgi:predicted RNase H-like nuclease (RuvC/YqgF family)
MARKKKFNNSYKLPDHVATEILGLNNKEIIGRATIEYFNWMKSEELKKADPALQAVTTQIRELETEVNEMDEVIELTDKLKELKETLSSEKIATYREEKKNLLEPYKEDLKFFKNSFKLVMDEIDRRKKDGLLTIDGKII